MAISNVFNAEGGTASLGTTEKSKDLSNQIGDSNQSFDLGQAYKTGTLRVYWNGVRQTNGIQISEASGTTFNTSFVAHPGDSLIVDYSPL
tara:strand:+ start:127 stop:396 length:270 start_codon:yes stop_codon:yes gene_type:complete